MCINTTDLTPYQYHESPSTRNKRNVAFRVSGPLILISDSSNNPVSGTPKDCCTHTHKHDFCRCKFACVKVSVLNSRMCVVQILNSQLSSNSILFWIWLNLEFWKSEWIWKSRVSWHEFISLWKIPVQKSWEKVKRSSRVWTNLNIFAYTTQPKWSETN